MHDSETGIGDASLIAKGLLYEKITLNFDFRWAALGGLKLPTGCTDWLGKPDYAEGIGGHDLTFGSGSVVRHRFTELQPLFAVVETEQPRGR